MDKILANLIIFVLFAVFGYMFTVQAVPREWHWLSILLLSILWLQFIKD